MLVAYGFRVISVYAVRCEIRVAIKIRLDRNEPRLSNRTSVKSIARDNDHSVRADVPREARALKLDSKEQPTRRGEFGMSVARESTMRTFFSRQRRGGRCRERTRRNVRVLHYMRHTVRYTIAIFVRLHSSGKNGFFDARRGRGVATVHKNNSKNGSVKRNFRYPSTPCATRFV